MGAARFDRLLWNLIVTHLPLRPDFSVDHTLNPQSKMSEHVDMYVYVSVDSFSDWQDYTKWPQRSKYKYINK